METIATHSLLQSQRTGRQVCYLNASLARALYRVVVVLGAARTAAGALPQEVKRAPVTCPRRTGAAPTEFFIIHFLPLTSFDIVLSLVLHS